MDDGDLEPADAGSPGSAGSAGELDLLLAALRQRSAELDVYARVLTETLADALPAGAVEVRRQQSMGDRLRGRPGEVVAVSARLDERTLALRSERGQVRAEIVREVRGIALSRQSVDFDTWLAELARGVTALADRSERSRAALARFLAGG
jgi:hypothetical protein